MESHLFLYYPKKDLELTLDALHACLGLQIQLLDDRGAPLLSYGDPAPYCRRAEACLPEGKTCQEEHHKSCLRAIDLGEPYIFCCHSGLYHIIYPLVNRDKLFGSILLGPFLMDGTDDDLIKHLAASSEIPVDTVLELYKDAQSIRELSPEQVVKVSRLLYYLVNSIVSGSRELQNANRERLLHQSRVGESIRRYKQEEASARENYPLDMERELLSLVRAGNTAKAREAFGTLFAQLWLYQKYDLDSLKIRLVELCSLLSRAALEKGASANTILGMNETLVRGILDARSADELSSRLSDNLDVFTGSLFYASDRSNGIVKTVTEYAHDHYMDKLTLAKIARKLGFSTPYLSALFNEVTGLPFREYLNQVRVEAAKRLLNSTDYPLMDIAIACGFSDQSYFTKVFKKYTGLSPGQYR